MSKQWFYQVLGATVGPVTSAELKLRCTKGQIAPDTPIRMGADGRWQAADHIKGLLDPVTAPPRPAAVAPQPVARASVQAVPAAAAPAPPPNHSFDHERTYHVVGDNLPHEDPEDSGEYDFFSFVGYELALGHQLYAALLDHCHRQHLTMTQATRRAVAELVGRKDLADNPPPSTSETDSEMKIDDATVEIPQHQ